MESIKEKDRRMDGNNMKEYKKNYRSSKWNEKWKQINQCGCMYGYKKKENVMKKDNINK